MTFESAILHCFSSFQTNKEEKCTPTKSLYEKFSHFCDSFFPLLSLILKVQRQDGRWLFCVIRIHATSIGEDLKTSFDGRDSDISECIEQFPCSLIIQLKLELHHTGPVFQYSKPVFPPAAAPSFPIFRHFFNSIFGKF